MAVKYQRSALPDCPRVVVIGCFDGVHLGHRALLTRAPQTRLRTTAVTFDPHPRLLVGDGVQLISSVSRRAELLMQAGIEDVLVTAFTRDVAEMSPHEWISSVLAPIGTQQVFVGAGFRFGPGRVGDVNTIREHGIDVVTCELKAGASSTRVRELIASGQLDEAEALLTRPVELEGALEVTQDPNSYRLRLDEGAICPPPGRYQGLTPSGPTTIVVEPRRRVRTWLSPATVSARLGSRWCLPLDSSVRAVG
jgi:riboflavin kinase/FMN adenylyltransferase